ncbi:MAG: trehalose-6-phosphate synthase [Dehalococcoidales bacterium]|jgi:trehalose 6-phosphate synthase
MSTRIVIVSNRLPVELEKDAEGAWQAKVSPGGLVTALSPVVKEKQGMWIGWPGIMEPESPEEILAEGEEELGFTLKPVMLTQEEYDKYYLGFSNEILWPLFHDLQSRCNFEPSYWAAYEAVNRKFARVIAENTTPNDYIWIQDYHLMLAARELRALAPDRRIGFFLHTPFPPPDIYNKLPWRQQILKGLLEFDLLGFQAARDRNNFLHCVGASNRNLRFDARRQISRIKMQGRAVRVGVFPISIDYDEFAHEAATKSAVERTEELRRVTANCQIILGVDRLDYSKGIPEKLKAYRMALELFSELRGMITLIQIIVPSRENIPEYQVMRTEIEQMVSEINGQFGHPGWTPINYMFRNLSRNELVSYYNAADVALVTPIKDGMNLVAKEFCTANIDEDAVLILSEFAGAAYQMGRYALVVNPYDVAGIANAIHHAYLMPVEERKARMRKLRTLIRRRDIYWWLDRFLKAATVDLDISTMKGNHYTISTV